MGDADILLIEAFYGGSHRVLTDLLHSALLECGYSVHLLTLSDKKWHWRARTGAMSLAQEIKPDSKYKVLFCSAVMNLAELIGLRLNLAGARKILYFHENQLIYPVKDQKDRDVQYGYNQIVSCLAADEVLFNSAFAMNSFLDRVDTFLKIIPDYRPKNVAENIRKKSDVLYFPLSISDQKIKTLSEVSKPEQLRILWPHRWEHDKNPELFFRVLLKLYEEGCDFTLAVLGQSHGEIPSIFEEARSKLTERIHHWGFADSQEGDYWSIIGSCHVAVSTADHETFGVAMLEATIAGCFPIAPEKLVYPEIFPSHCLWKTENQLYKKLKNYTIRPQNAIKDRESLEFDPDRFSWEKLKPKYLRLFKT